ncbi:MAG TPA: acyl-CoA desaturase [Phycisphaerales bacterium]|nr:acyl-CoA desaturase [Phycisphaerales bacterium]
MPQEVPARVARQSTVPSELKNDTSNLEIERPPMAERIGTLAAVTLPPVGLVWAIIYLWGTGITWHAFAIMVIGYVLTAFGVTVGYHRYFTHKSFDCGPVTRFVLGVLGSMAAEGPVIRWVAMHRRHHQFSDHEGDPHSPHAFKGHHHHHRHKPSGGDPHEESHHAGLGSVLKGFFHAHMGWFFNALPKDLEERYAKDLVADPVTRFVSNTFWVWILLSAVLPAVAGWLWVGTWVGAIQGFLWGGLVRLLMVHHVTWSINSVCHLWGSRPFNSHDHSRNNAIMGILAMGEGWHNNHHAFPTSARHGLKWYQFDSSYILIKLMSYVGLAKNVRVPDQARMEAKERSAA